MNRFSMILFLILFSTNTFASKKTLIWTNSNCEKTNTCELEKFEITITRDKDGEFSKTYMEGFYQTKNINTVEDYAIVQFIKGGMFNESRHDREPIKLFYNTVRTFFGKTLRPFIHPYWVIDSYDADPIFASWLEQNDRHALYKIKNDESRSVIFDHNKYYTHYFYRPELKLPRMHFSDIPSGGRFIRLKIQAGPNAGKTLTDISNASMEFKTCIFKTTDVAINGNENSLTPDDALGCLNWNNHHIFNWKTEEFDDAQTLDLRALKQEV